MDKISVCMLKFFCSLNIVTGFLICIKLIVHWNVETFIFVLLQIFFFFHYNVFFLFKIDTIHSSYPIFIFSCNVNLSQNKSYFYLFILQFKILLSFRRYFSGIIRCSLSITMYVFLSCLYIKTEINSLKFSYFCGFCYLI